MFELISRNRKVYTRDRLAFFMSFLSVIILILVYQVFLGQIQIDAVKEALGSDTASSDTIKMVNYWLISGLTTIISMTSTLGAFGVMVSKLNYHMLFLQYCLGLFLPCSLVFLRLGFSMVLLPCWIIQLKTI